MSVLPGDTFTQTLFHRLHPARDLVDQRQQSTGHEKRGLMTLPLGHSKLPPNDSDSSEHSSGRKDGLRPRSPL